MVSKTKRDLVIVANHEGSAYFQKLKEETNLHLIHVSNLLEQCTSKKLIEVSSQECRAYIHGHEVGGTNPGLLEVLAQTNENLVLGVDFNKKVLCKVLCYWSKDGGNLARLIDQIDGQAESIELGKAAKNTCKKPIDGKKSHVSTRNYFLLR